MVERRALVVGVGVNDSPTPVPRADKSYRTWLRLLYRVYGKRNAGNQCYSDCSVDPVWHSFSAFREWHLKQSHEGNQLDKDILVPGNRVYGPDTCCYVPHYLNMIGPRLNQPCVNRQKRGKPWGARINCDGKFRWIGSYDTEEEAVSAWWGERKKDVQRLIARYEAEPNPDARVIEALRQLIAT